MIPINFAGVPSFQWDQFTVYRVAEQNAIKTGTAEQVQIEILFANLPIRAPNQKQVTYREAVKHGHTSHYNCSIQDVTSYF